MFKGRENRVAGDLVKDHAADRDSGLEHLEQVPADGLAFAVFISCEQQTVAALELTLERRDDLLLFGRHQVQRFEVVFDVHAQRGPLLFFLYRVGDVRRAGGQIAHVADARLYDVVLAEELPQGLRLGRRLNDDEGASHNSSLYQSAWSSVSGQHTIIAVTPRGRSCHWTDA